MKITSRLKPVVLLIVLSLLISLVGVAVPSLSGTAYAAAERNWVSMNSGTTQILNGIWGTAANDVYAVGYGGTILHYDGSNWTRMTSGTTAMLSAIWGTSSTNIFAVGFEHDTTFTGKILRYNGTSWSTMATLPNIELNGVGGSGSYIYACGKDHTFNRGVIYRKEGWNWIKEYTSSYAENYNDIWGYSYAGYQDYIYFAGKSEVLEYIPGLKDPTKLLFSGADAFYGIWGSMSTGWDLVAVGGNPDYHNTYGDIRFHDLATDHHDRTIYELFLADVWGVSNTDVYAVGGVMDRGRIIHYDGTSWKDTTTSTTGLNGVWGCSSTDFFAVGWDGTILRLNIGPNKPSNISPTNGAIDVSLTCTLQSSAFSDPNFGDTHAASQWQITATPGNYSSPVYDSGTDVVNKTSLTVPGGTLTGNTIYYWRVRHQDNNSAWSDWSSTKSFTTLIPPPTITSLNPASAGIGSETTVVITGNNFSGATAVSFTGIITESFTVDSPTQITADIYVPPDAVEGPRNVEVTTPGGVATLANGFIVEKVLGPPIQAPTPTITSIEPASGAPGQTIQVLITGNNLSGIRGLNFGQEIHVNTVTVYNNTKISVSISINGDATDGPRDVSVTTSEGIATLANGFIVEKVLGPPIATPLPPSITSLNPASAGIGDDTTVVITGNNLSGAMGLGFPGMLISSFTVDSPTQITAVIHIPPDYAGPPVVDFSVTTPGGTATLDNGFTVEEVISPQTPTTPEQTPTTPEQIPATPGWGLSCERSPTSQNSGLGDLALLFGVVFVCFGLTRFRRR